MPDDLFSPAAITRPADDLDALARDINAAHAAAEGSMRAGLEHARAAGEKLARAKKACGHGNWLLWLKANVRFSQPTAWAYMRVAANWDKLSAADNLQDALRILTKKDRKEGVAEASAEPDESADDEEQEDSSAPALKGKGVGLLRANEAINVLKLVPVDDPLREDAFRMVLNWIKHNQ
jgi:hypothetical protein